MNKFFSILALSAISTTSAQARDIDTCTTFIDSPPGVNDQLLCEKEKQHVADMGLPPADEITVFSLNELYEIGWSLISVHRFQNVEGNFIYRVYITRDK